MMINIATRLLGADKKAVLDLWNNEYPAILAYADIAAFDAYMDALADKLHYLLISATGAVLGWAMTFTRDEEKWFAIIIDHSMHGRGYGTRMLDRLKDTELSLNGWVSVLDTYKKLNGTPYISPLGFYLRNGFALTGHTLDTGQLSAAKICWQR
ncbi:GNAT family N-acetyltransferase [Nemorincola caseinilytica]